MQEVCNSLADTGSSIWLPIVGGVLCVIIATVCLLYARRHGKRLTYSGFGMLLFMVLGLVTVSAHPAHAASTCNATSSNTSSTPATPSQSGTLELVDDNYTTSSSLLGDYYEYNLDILANDQPPAGDPIDPATARLSGATSQYLDVGPDFDEPTGVDFSILNPSDPDGPTWGYVYMCGDYNDSDVWIYNGKVCVYFEDDVPAGTVFTMRYTAKTMSGIDASNPATITITVPTPPAPPELVDDNYTLGTSGGAVLSVLDNDQPDANDPLDTTTLELQNPNQEAGGYGTDYCTDPNGNQSSSEDSTATCWEVIDGKVVVTFGDDVPTDTPLSISYHITSEGGLEPDQDGVITVTRSSSQVSSIIVADADFPNSCGTHSGDTVNLLDFASTTSGTLDPLTIDLDPVTPGRQTSYSDDDATITVNSSGIVTITKPGGAGTETGDHTFYYTINNTMGDTSGVGIIRAFRANCG